MDGLLVQLVSNQSLLFEPFLLKRLDLLETSDFLSLLSEIAVQCHYLVSHVFLGKHVVLHSALKTG